MLHTVPKIIFNLNYLILLLCLTFSFTLKNLYEVVKARHAMCPSQCSFNIHYFTSFGHWTLLTYIIRGYFQSEEGKSEGAFKKTTQLLLDRPEQLRINDDESSSEKCSIALFSLSLRGNATEVHLSFLSNRTSMKQNYWNSLLESFWFFFF